MKPIASRTSSAGRDSSVPGTRSKGGTPVLRCQAIAVTRPARPSKPVVEIENQRSPPSFNAYDVRSFIGQRGPGARAAARGAGDALRDSVKVIDAAASRV